MDYRELLKKYMAHIVECEGIDYVYGDAPEVEMSSDEWGELRALSDELRLEAMDDDDD